MLGVCMTCTAMSGNGVRIGMRRIYQVLLPTQMDHHAVRIGCFAEAAGTASPAPHHTRQPEPRLGLPPLEESLDFDSPDGIRQGQKGSAFFISVNGRYLVSVLSIVPPKKKPEVYD